VFTNDFSYAFSSSTDPTLVQKFGGSWSKDDEVTSARHLFRGYTPQGGPTYPAASAIDIDLSEATPSGSDTVVGLDWETHKFVAARINGAITVPVDGSDPIVYTISGNYMVFYLVRGDAAVNLDSSQPADADHWYVYRWLDRTQSIPSGTVTWSAIKAFYRAKKI
jgi:hypothetical protein